MGNTRIENINALIKACQNKMVRTEFISNNAVIVDNRFLFINFKTPLNSSSFEKLCNDKDFSFIAFGKHVKIPRYISFLDPNIDKKYKDMGFTVYDSIEDIACEIYRQFENNMPCIIKKNSGSLGVNVFKTGNYDDILSAVNKIFNNDKNYDYLLIASEYIYIKTEYRVVVLNNKIELVYLKDNSGAKFVGNLSPLHFDNSKAVKIMDSKVIKRIEMFLKPLFDNFAINFAGFDIAIDNNNEMYFIEINSSPGFEIYIRDNGYNDIVILYEKMIEYLNKLPK